MKLWRRLWRLLKMLLCWAQHSYSKKPDEVWQPRTIFSYPKALYTCRRCGKRALCWLVPEHTIVIDDAYEPESEEPFL